MRHLKKKKTRAPSLIKSFISVHSHKQIIVSVYEDRNVHQLKQKCGLQGFHRLALIIKMKHALNMCIFFPFTYNYIVEVRPIKYLILIRKAFFSLTLIKTCMVIFQI